MTSQAAATKARPPRPGTKPQKQWTTPLGRSKECPLALRDSAELRQITPRSSASKGHLASPPFDQPSSPPAASAAKKHIAARCLQRFWRRAQLRKELHRLQRVHVGLLSKQSQLETARATRKNNSGDILTRMRRARRNASAFVQQQKSNAREAERIRLCEVARQDAARKIQMHWQRRCKPSANVSLASPREEQGEGLSQLTLTLNGASTGTSAADSPAHTFDSCRPADSIGLPRHTSPATATAATPALLHRDKFPTLSVSEGGSVAAGVRTHVSTLKSSLAARDAEVKELRQRCEALEQACVDAQSQAAQEVQKETQKLRDEYDATMARQLSFADELLKDKQELAEKCDTLGSELDSTQACWEERLKKQAATEKRELKRQRELWAAAEKVRRDKWMEESMAQVKAQTIRGLEPEVQRLLAQHKSDIAAVEQTHRAALRRARDDMLEESNQNIRRVRQELLAERTEALRHERDLASARQRELTDQSEAATRHDLAARTKQAAEWEAERAKMERALLEAQHLLEAATAREQAMRAMGVERKHSATELGLEHQQAISAVREKLVAEKENAIRSLRSEHQEQLGEQREEIRLELAKERDAQLETILNKLARETEERRQTLHTEFKARVESLQAEHHAELQKAHQESREWMGKFGCVANGMLARGHMLRTTVLTTALVQQRAADLCLCPRAQRKFRTANKTSGRTAGTPARKRVRRARR